MFEIYFNLFLLKLGIRISILWWHPKYRCVCTIKYQHTELKWKDKCAKISNKIRLVIGRL